MDNSNRNRLQEQAGLSPVGGRPNLFIVGAAKSGTTSISNYLNAHPDVYFSPLKEPHHFCKDIRHGDFSQEKQINNKFDVTEYLAHTELEKRHIAFVESQNEYMQIFREAENQRIVGEASTGYLFSEVAAKEIYAFNPQAKILIVLRDPVDRAYSHWKMNLVSGMQDNKIPFLKAMQRDFNAANKGYGRNHMYIEIGQYYAHIRRYLELFPPENVKILYFDALKGDVNTFMAEVYSFLQVQPIQHRAGEKSNVSRWIKYQSLKQLNDKFNVSRFIPQKAYSFIKEQLSSTEFPILTTADKISLYSSYFNQDIVQLEQYLKVDLSKWKY